MRPVSISSLFVLGITLLSPLAYSITVGEFEGQTGYRFKKGSHLAQAFEHPSRYPANRKTFERLEFLGDNILDTAIATYLYDTLPAAGEGQLTQTKARLVSNKNNRIVFGRMGLEPFLQYTTADGSVDKIKSDTCEAIIGAIYRDGGQRAVDAIVQRFWIEGYTAAAPTSSRAVSSASAAEAKAAKDWMHTEVFMKQKKSVQYVTAKDGTGYTAQLIVGKVLQPGKYYGGSKGEAKRLAALAYKERQIATAGPSSKGKKAGGAKKKAPTVVPLLTTRTSTTTTTAAAASQGNHQLSVSFRGFSGTYSAKTKQRAKRLAAQAMHQHFVNSSASLKKALSSFHKYCQDRGWEFPNYIFN